MSRRLDDINPIPKNRSMPLTADGDESSQLAANIFDGVKARMVEMQHQMKVAEQRAEAAEEEAKRNQEQAEAWVREAEARAAMQLERQQQENKSTIARHLEFIDRHVLPFLPSQFTPSWLRGQDIFALCPWSLQGAAAFWGDFSGISCCKGIPSRLRFSTSLDNLTSV